MAAKLRTASWIDWFLFGHFWIAISAAGLAWATDFLSTGLGQLQSWHAMVLLGTLALYSWHRILSFSRKGTAQDAPRYILVLLYPILSRTIAVLASIACIVLALSSPPPWALLVISLLLTGGYVLPIGSSGSGWLRRSYLKPLIVAAGWTVVTAALPLFYSGNLLVNWGTFLICAERFFFTLCVAVCFDWRDREIDKKQGIATLAQGPIIWSKTAASMSLLFAFTSCFILSRAGIWNNYANAMILSYITALPLIYFLGDLKGDYRFAWLYNGILALPPFYIWILISWPG